MTGQVILPPYIAWNFAAKLTIWSAASVAKSANMISTTGLMPAKARPLATPAMPASAIGVEKTCSGNRLDNPRLTLKAPPYGSSRSSPIRITSG